MNRTRTPITSLGLAILLAACGSNTSTPQQTGTGGSGDGGSGGSASGGSGGDASGGSGGSQSGGSGGTASGGSGGSQSGGSGGTSSGGAGGSQSGGSGGTASGGAGGKASGGSGGSATGGTTTTGAGGAAGGATGSGGSQSGGTTGSGGSSNAGGTTASSTALVTSASGAYWKTGTWTEVTSGTADVTVNDTSAAQTWDGFGGAFNEKGWSYLTTKALQDEAMGLLFGTDGAHFAWGRIPMGASDYGMDRYTDDETANDTSMASFSISRDQEKLIPYIKAAQAVRSDLKFWASPWTPPTWMKSGKKSDATNNFDGGKMKSDATTLTAHAQYFVKFVQEYAKQGITIDYVAPQNEPNYEQNYPSCLWDASTFATFVGKYLGPAFTTAGLSAKIMGGTMSNSDSGKDGTVLSTLMGDSTAKPYIKVIGLQWGMLENAMSNPSTYSAYGAPLWATEHKCGNYPWASGYKEPAPNDQAYAVESWGLIRDAINKAKVTSYNAWNMVLDSMGKGIDTARQWAQDSLLVVNGGAITKTPAYYVFRHMSQFVDVGAKVVGTSGSTDAVAWKNPDGSLVVVVYSGSAKSNYTVAIGGKKLQFSMPGGGWATVKYAP